MSKTYQSGNAGKHDEACERLSLELDASAVVLIVVDGKHGSCMSVSVNPARPGAAQLASGARLAAMLRYAADHLDAGERPNGVRATVVTRDRKGS